MQTEFTSYVSRMNARQLAALEQLAAIVADSSAEVAEQIAFASEALADVHKMKAAAVSEVAVSMPNPRPWAGFATEAEMLAALERNTAIEEAANAKRANTAWRLAVAVVGELLAGEAVTLSQRWELDIVIADVADVLERHI